jgi:stress response protein SCP2
MAVDLIKRGQTIDLTKNRSGLDSITIGLSWGGQAEVKAKESKGFLARMFDKAVGEDAPVRTSSASSMDIDSSVVMVTEAGQKLDLIYYGEKRSNCGSIIHAGDDLTGNDKKGVYDNEEIKINLTTIPSNVKSLKFIANVYQGQSRGHDFGQVKGAYIRVLQTSNRDELIRYNLSEDYNGMRGIIVGELYRHNNEWKFRAIGQGTPSDSLTELVQVVIN